MRGVIDPLRRDNGSRMSHGALTPLSYFPHSLNSINVSPRLLFSFVFLSIQRYLSVMARPSEHNPTAGRQGDLRRSLQADCTGEFYLSSTLFQGGVGCYALVMESVYATGDGKRIVATTPLTSSSDSEVGRMSMYAR